MLVHVACKANIAGLEGVLTYRAERAQVGQLVLVRLRGRRVPGVVMSVDVPAGTSQAILPVLAQSDKPLPTPYLKWLRLVADWYALPLSPTVAQLASNLNGPYLICGPAPAQTGSQRLWLTPAETTALATFLRPRAQMIPEAQAARRALWWQAALGAPLKIWGTAAALHLPYRNLAEITLEAPLASSYYGDRSPGLHGAVLAALLAQAHGANLTIRTSIPLPLLQKRLPLPEKVRIQTPRYHPIEVIPRKDRGRLNQDLVDNLKRALRDGRRVLVYHNHLPGQTKEGRPVGLQALATRLGAVLEQPVGVVTARAELPATPIVVATATTLYRLTDQFDQIVVPDVDSLTSPNQPWSNLAALDVLGTLASRAPLTAQGHDPTSPLYQALLNQLEPAALATLPWPTFSGRLIRVKWDQPLATPDNWTVIQQNDTGLVAQVARLSTPTDRQFIAAARERGHVWTDEWTWPPLSDTVVPQ